MSKESMESGTESILKGSEVAPADGVKPLGETLVDFFSILTKWRRFIVRFVGIVSVGAVLFALVSPKWYKASASVFPAEKADLFGGLEGISSLVRSFSPGRSALSSLTGNTEAQRYMAILSSETALLKVIERFNLTKVYEITRYPREKTIKELLSNVDFTYGDQNQLLVTVYDKEPQRTADMANYFVQVLNEINSELNSQNARANREFIETRYIQNLVDLRSAEDSLKSFQLRHGVVLMPEQLEASVKAMAEIYGKLAIKEVELNVLRKSFSESHPSVALAELEVNAFRGKISELNRGTSAAKGEMKILVPFGQAPELGAEYVRLYRNVEIQNKILQFVTPLFEQAKVEEKRATPSVIVLDPALVPERKAKPKASLYGLLAAVISTVVALTLVFAVEGVRRLRAMNPERVGSLWGTARSDWFGLKWRRSPNR